MNIAWRSQPSRQYRIWRADGLTPPQSWLDLGLGLIQPDSGASTSLLIPNGGSLQGFYRIEAIQPLAP